MHFGTVGGGERTGEGGGVDVLTNAHGGNFILVGLVLSLAFVDMVDECVDEMCFVVLYSSNMDWSLMCSFQVLATSGNEDGAGTSISKRSQCHDFRLECIGMTCISARRRGRGLPMPMS